MKTIFAREAIDWDGNSNGSVFLAGPTPRDPVTPTWRKYALEIFEKLEFKGIVLLPEDRTWKYREDYNAQVEWEFNALTASDLIMFWVPRELTTMPAFTTNVEFGWWMSEKPSKVLLGSPAGTPKMTYLNWHADRRGIRRFSDLEEMIQAAMDSLSNRSVSGKFRCAECGGQVELCRKKIAADHYLNIPTCSICEEEYYTVELGALIEKLHEQ